MPPLPLFFVLFGNLAAVFLTVVLQPVSVFAQTTAVEEIIVTADIRDRGQLELAASISAIDEEMIRAQEARHLEEILSLAANVNLSQGSNRARFYQIRGLGERSQFTDRINPSVGLLIDGVDFSGAGTAGVLFDVEQVEILRGPQATRYGSGALAGLINVRTKEPTSEFDNHLEVQLGSHGLFSGGISHSGPILPGRLLYRVAVQQARSDGFIENDHLGREDTNGQDEFAGRFKLQWFVYQDLQLDLHLGYIDIDNGYDAFSLNNSRTTLSDQPGQDRQKSLQAGLRLALDTDRTRFEFLANLSDSDIDYGYDEDWVFRGFDSDEYTSTDRYKRSRETSSVEWRFLSRPEASPEAATQWLAGLYYLGRTVDLTRDYTNNFDLADNSLDFTSDYDTRQYAAYGEVNRRLGTNWTLTLGLRGELWEADYRETGVRFDPNDLLFGGKVALEYSPNEQTLWYTAIVRGYKAGGFNADPQVPRKFDSETLYNLEFGLKKHWMSGRLSTYLTLFYMRREDAQIRSSFSAGPSSPGAAPVFVEYIGNAVRGRNCGLEFELAYRPNTSWQLNASLGVLDTEYTRFVGAGGVDLSGRDQAHAPQWQYAVSGQYHFARSWTLGLSAQGRDNYYFSDSHNAQSTRSHWLNLRLGYSPGRFGLSFWLRNLTDEDIETRGFFFGNDPRIGYAEAAYTQLGEPRRFGMTASFDF